MEEFPNGSVQPQPAPVQPVPVSPAFTPMPKRVKMMWVLGLVILFSAGAYGYRHEIAKVLGIGSFTGPEVQLQTVQGRVTEVSADALQIAVTTATTSVPRTVPISPTTKIEKIFSQKNASSTTEEEIPVEVNIEDVQTGTVVTVTYQSEKDSVLSGVSRVTFTSDESVDAYTEQSLQSLTADPNGYIKGEVVSVDVTGKKLSYKPYTFITLGTEVMSVTFPENIPVYSVDSALRLTIAHARETIALADIQQEQTIFIMIDRKSLSGNGVVPLAFIVLGT
ncbi:hypothetical protein A3I46_01040 [Candidatus Kaiserbacteria bacterium RIFCSPLOWO2_02_FULL_54_13]|uniref:Uncharacterized protein n=1 Tax=Candidatus Kaiserbacteria bacterium RIFCSPHIGHO2_02_FULL_54_22 TaxID=1798495 RepID=A0A1F6DNV4_9BACT|nr:MAG: hypothetical protein A3C19_03300 [Candidatus Kaiserbacteria bacterium RIFCSPHIGHO2_02_FULL_54_22]OGG67876.1 MAG: hypothetical protein A3E99_03720 [Candidatus Kaiserbacteria bacterium RIFCSPHIGHO2_12_FULL_54_16]OGG83002.1 MAG: hypothetical protein A3I46_01040 [Candidatus Kaiserbacteria bacterium RIFCSPLOWO2_02_FULL_54_13]